MTIWRLRSLWLAAACTLVAWAAASRVVPAASAQAAAQPATRPNVVIVLLDDMGWSDIGPFGSEIATPHLDALAARGVRFAQFYATPRCSPTRASLLTGLYSHQAGMGHLDNVIRRGSIGTTGRLNDQSVTMAEVLREAGYFTAMSGKWHLGQDNGSPPWDRGFERTLSLRAGGMFFPNQNYTGGDNPLTTRAQEPLFLNGTATPRDASVFGKDWYATYLWTEFGLKFVDEARQASKPFFLYLPFNAPHFPLMAPAELIAKYRGKYKAGWDRMRQERYQRQVRMGLIDAKWPLSPREPGTPPWDSLSDQQKERFDHQMAVYAAMIEAIDISVGTLVKGLEARGVLDNTLIFFMSDNGGNAESGPDGRFNGDPPGGPNSDLYLGMNWAAVGNTPFRRFKHFTHEGGIASPLIVHWPRGIVANRRGAIERQPAHLIDIMTTVTAATGAKYPTEYKGRAIHPMEGVNLRPALDGRPLNRPRPLFWEHEGNRAVRSGNWKIVSVYPEPWELYDIAADRVERNNVAAQHADVVTRLSAEWDAWAKRTNVDPWPGPARLPWGDDAPATDASAQITRLEILSRTTSNDPAFGAVGPYEIIKGRAHGELDPRDRRNAIIQDIGLAPRNTRGRVPYVATFTLARPLDPAKTSGVLMYNVVNRGGGDVTPDGAGHVWLVSGWQGDVRPTATNQTVDVPTATNPDGSPVLGIALQRFSDLAPGTSTVTVATPRDPNATSAPIYRQAAADQRAAALISVAAETTTGRQTGIVTIPRADWAFADCRTVPFPGTPDRTRLCLKGGFDPNLLYQLVYTAQDPLVLGVGLAATRDLVSYLRYDRASENPVAGTIRHVVSIGNSQSGNFIKTFIHLGFNEDLAGRIVWDGAFPRIAGRQTPMNFRFALPGGAGSLFEPGSEGVLTWGRYEDKARGRSTASLLDRCSATKTCPKVIEAFGSTELWGLRMSPGLIGTDARADIPLPATVRRFYYPGTSHGGGRGGFSVDLPAPGGNAGCTLPANPNPQAEQTRALTQALVEWVTRNIEPPASRFPRLSRGELVPATRAALGFPNVPQIPFADDFVNSVLDYDFGPEFRANDLSGTMSRQPPRIIQVIPTYVPKVNADGNEIAGAPSVLHQAPLATYLGWNVTAAGFAKGRICGFNGGAIPFAKTKAERQATGDPRLSVEERYGTLEGYVCTVRAAANRMVSDRLLLREDADRTIRQAQASNVLPASTESSAEARAIERRLCGNPASQSPPGSR